MGGGHKRVGHNLVTKQVFQKETGDRWLDGFINSTDMNLRKLREIVKDRDAWRAAVHGVEESDVMERPNNKRQGVGDRESG